MSKLSDYWTAVKTKLNEWWLNTLSFFKYSHTILVARLTILTGFITTVLGSLDWSPLLGVNIDTGFSKNQVIWLGIIMTVKGVIDEIVRRVKGQVKPEL